MYIKWRRLGTTNLFHLPEDCKWQLFGGQLGEYSEPVIVLLTENETGKENQLEDSDKILFERFDVDTDYKFKPELGEFCATVVEAVAEMLVDGSYNVLDMNQIINEQWLKTQKEWLQEGLIERLDQYSYFYK